MWSQLRERMRVVAVADAAVFMAHMPCLIGAERVLDSMGQIVQGHAWGLGVLEGARFKGGWGPRGTYQMRQMGIVPTPDGGYVGLVWAMESVTGGGCSGYVGGGDGGDGDGGTGDRGRAGCGVCAGH